MKKEKIINLMRDNFIKKASFVAQNSNYMRIKESSDFISVDCGLPSDTFNVSVVKKKPSNFDDFLQRAVDVFTDKKYPMALWSWEDIAEEIKEKGVCLAEENIGMYAVTSDLNISLEIPHNLTIKEVNSVLEVKQFGETISKMFGESEEAQYIREYYNRLSRTQLYKNSSFKFYIGSLEDSIVSTGSAFYTQDSVGIYDIATLNEYRKKGIGTAMFNYILTDIKENYDGLCILQASEAGANIYKRSGFKPVCRISVFENRDMLKKD